MIRQSVFENRNSVHVRRGASKDIRSKPQSSSPAKNNTPIILIGSSGIYEEGLQQVLRAHGFHSICRAATLEAVDDTLAAKARIVIVMEALDGASLPETMTAMRDRDPALRVVLLVNTSNPEHIAAAFRFPAHAFLCQRIACDSLMKALDIVLIGGAVLSFALVNYLLGRVAEQDEIPLPVAASASFPAITSHRSLSDREVEVLHCLTSGDSNKLIARRFQIAESTVKIHVKGILRKTNVQNRTQAAMWGLAQTPPFGGHAALCGEDVSL